MIQRRPAAFDDPVAVANFRAIQHLLGQFGSFVVLGLGDAMGINPG
jgi:hypothetical protein